jgi:predicted dehydrogenase
MIGLHHQHPRWYNPLWSNLPQYKPLAIADADEEFLASENEQHFHLDAHSDYREMLGRDDIDVVIIWLPHSEMPQAVEDAAAAGKHVIVEKPCAADLAGAHKIVDVARQYPKIKISSPYCWRTHPMTEKLIAAVRAGKLGDVTAMEGRLNAGSAQRYIRDNSPWMLKSSEGGGPMWNLGVHWIDFFRWATGSEVVSVQAAVSGPVGEPKRDIEDNAQGLLTFESGAVAMLDISYSLPESYPGKRDIYMAMRGTKGDIAWAPAWECLTDTALLVSETETDPALKQQRVEATSRDIPGYCGEMAWRWLADFAQAVVDDRDPIVMPADILAAIEVVDAYYRSLETGRAEPVQ